MIRGIIRDEEGGQRGGGKDTSDNFQDKSRIV